MPCLFCKIIAKELASYIVFEDDVCMAFLDTRPLFPGHCLLVPKKHFATLVDLEPALVEPLFFNARLLSGIVEHVMEAEGTFVAINNKVSQSVPHLHIHVVPRKKKDGLKGFFWPRNPYRDEAHIEEIRQRISRAVVSINEIR